MSRMSDAYIEIMDLVAESIEAGAYYVSDVVDFVNQRSTLKVDRETVDSIIKSLDFDYGGGATHTMLMNKENGNA